APVPERRCRPAIAAAARAHRGAPTFGAPRSQLNPETGPPRHGVALRPGLAHPHRRRAPPSRTEPLPAAARRGTPCSAPPRLKSTPGLASSWCREAPQQVVALPPALERHRHSSPPPPAVLLRRRPRSRPPPTSTSPPPS